MASASSSAPGVGKVVAHGVAPLRAGQGYSFVLRRLHSLTGIMPVGAFLFEHILISNSTAISGPDAYERQVSFLANLPLVFFLELFGIWLPILFHALYGFYIWYRETEIRSLIPGPATGCTPRSAGPAGSLSPTSSGTPTPCASPESTCTTIPWRRSAKCSTRSCTPDYSSSTWCGLIAARGNLRTASGCSARSGASSRAIERRSVSGACVGLLLVLCAAGFASLYTFRTRPLQEHPPANGNIAR